MPNAEQALRNVGSKRPSAELKFRVNCLRNNIIKKHGVEIASATIYNRINGAHTRYDVMIDEEIEIASHDVILTLLRIALESTIIKESEVKTILKNLKKYVEDKPSDNFANNFDNLEI